MQGTSLSLAIPIFPTADDMYNQFGHPQTQQLQQQPQQQQLQQQQQQQSHGVRTDKSYKHAYVAYVLNDSNVWECITKELPPNLGTDGEVSLKDLSCVAPVLAVNPRTGVKTGLTVSTCKEFNMRINVAGQPGALVTKRMQLKNDSVNAYAAEYVGHWPDKNTAPCVAISSLLNNALSVQVGSETIAPETSLTFHWQFNDGPSRRHLNVDTQPQLPSTGPTPTLQLQQTQGNMFNPANQTVQPLSQQSNMFSNMTTQQQPQQLQSQPQQLQTQPQQQQLQQQLQQQQQQLQQQQPNMFNSGNAAGNLFGTTGSLNGMPQAQGLSQGMGMQAVNPMTGQPVMQGQLGSPFDHINQSGLSKMNL